ncbi:MAG: hypothetical protein ABIT20_05000 [Gemmatimonadaceae bacterium]
MIIDSSTLRGKLILGACFLPLLIAYVAVREAADEGKRVEQMAAVARTTLERSRIIETCTTADQSHACTREEFTEAERRRDSLRLVFIRELKPR